MKMPGLSLTRNLLRVRLAFARFGAGALLAGALLLGAALLWAVLLPGLSARVDERARAVAQARSTPLPKPVVSAPALASQRLAAFYAALGDGARTDGIIARLFDAASETGVALDKGEYKPAHDIAGRFDIYTIVLPVKGDYASLRRFSEKVLASVPYAALDDMRFKRNSMSDQAVEANLRFTAFLRPATWAPVPAAVLVSAAVSASATASATASASASEAARAVSPALATASATASASASARAVSPASATASATAQSPASPIVRSLAPPLPPSMASATRSASLAAPVTIPTPSPSPQPSAPAPKPSDHASKAPAQTASLLARAPSAEVRR